MKSSSLFSLLIILALGPLVCKSQLEEVQPAEDLPCNSEYEALSKCYAKIIEAGDFQGDAPCSAENQAALKCSQENSTQTDAPADDLTVTNTDIGVSAPVSAPVSSPVYTEDDPCYAEMEARSKCLREYTSSGGSFEQLEEGLTDFPCLVESQAFNACFIKYHASMENLPCSAEYLASAECSEKYIDSGGQFLDGFDRCLNESEALVMCLLKDSNEDDVNLGEDMCLTEANFAYLRCTQEKCNECQYADNGVEGPNNDEFLQTLSCDALNSEIEASGFCEAFNCCPDCAGESTALANCYLSVLSQDTPIVASGSCELEKCSGVSKRSSVGVRSGISILLTAAAAAAALCIN